MKVASINREEYVLESIEDAENLLRIINRAVPVKYEYKESVYVRQLRSTYGTLQISISDERVVFEDEYAILKSAEKSEAA